MTRDKIERLQKLNAEIKNFQDCYEGEELWGHSDGPVDAVALISYLIEHPEFQKIADNIKKLDV